MSGAAGSVADATGNWVDTLAPAWLRPYLRLARLDRPIGSWLLLLPCWWSAALATVAAPALAPHILHLILFFIGAVSMRRAGCNWNAIVDRVLVGAASGLSRRLRPARSGAACARCRRDLLGDRLQHHLRPPGPRGRCADRHQIHRAVVRDADQADAGAVLWPRRHPHRRRRFLPRRGRGLRAGPNRLRRPPRLADRPPPHRRPRQLPQRVHVR